MATWANGTNISIGIQWPQEDDKQDKDSQPKKAYKVT